MKYVYIVALLVVLGGMFYIGDRVPQSPDLTYSTAPSEPLSSTYTKREYCAPEVDTEVAKYQLELSAAQNKISQLEAELETIKATITPSPTPEGEEEPTVTPTPTEDEDITSDQKKASTSADR